MDNKDKRVIEKMLQYANSICEYIKDIHSAVELKNNSLVAEAVCFDLLQIGELARVGLSEECKKSIPVPWTQINGLRNRIVHGYSEINFEIIYETITVDMPGLIEELMKYLKGTK